MAILRGLQILVITIAISSALSIPVKRSKAKSSRQIELTTPSTAMEQRTGYPEAGFRPKIPFDLPDEKPQHVTESVELITTAQSTIESLDEVVPTTVKSDVADHTPADTYGAPLPAGNDVVEIEAEVVPAPAEDFQLPSEEANKDFLSTFDVINNIDGDVIADLPAIKQTSKALNFNTDRDQLPTKTYGVPEFGSSGSRINSETVSEEFDLEPNKSKSDDEEQQQQEKEGSGESELEFAFESGIRKPADTYGSPNTEFEEDNEVDSELDEVEQQLEILSRLTLMKSGRLVILPIDKNLYFGRLVPIQPEQAQPKNGRLLKL